jgi:hypothetical protein
VKTKAAKPADVAASEPVAPMSDALVIEQGYCLKAWIDNPYLMVEQKDHDGKADTF